MLTPVLSLSLCYNICRTFMKKKPILATVITLVLLMANFSYATTVQRLDLKDLVNKARMIVVGKVTNSRTYWTADRKIILTAYTIQVDESVKGQAPRTVEVTA